MFEPCTTIDDGIALAAAHLRDTGPGEWFVALHCDRGLQLLGRSTGQSSRRDRLVLPVRRIVVDALACDAQVMLLAHSHPDGDPAPSKADIAATRTLVPLLREIDIALVDHIIVGEGGKARSFRALGLL